MKLCKQRYKYDCFLAAMATVLQKDYDVLWPKSFQERIEINKGSYNGLADEGYRLLGLKPDVDYWATPVIHKVLYPSQFLRYFRGHPITLQVPSLNDIGSSHLIVYADGQVLDPSNRQTYSSPTDIQTVEWVTVFTHDALNRL
jgi:hypothetical protein